MRRNIQPVSHEYSMGKDKIGFVMKDRYYDEVRNLTKDLHTDHQDMLYKNYMGYLEGKIKN